MSQILLGLSINAMQLNNHFKLEYLSKTTLPLVQLYQLPAYIFTAPFQSRYHQMGSMHCTTSCVADEEISKPRYCWIENRCNNPKLPFAKYVKETTQAGLVRCSPNPSVGGWWEGVDLCGQASSFPGGSRVLLSSSLV